MFRMYTQAEEAEEPHLQEPMADQVMVVTEETDHQILLQDQMSLMEVAAVVLLIQEQVALEVQAVALMERVAAVQEVVHQEILEVAAVELVHQDLEMQEQAAVE